DPAFDSYSLPNNSEVWSSGPTWMDFTLTQLAAAMVEVPKLPFYQQTRAHLKDSSMFEIEVQSILRGQDTRTTIMVKWVAKWCTHQQFAKFLADCGLSDRYTFVYLPFDKKTEQAKGMAFVNFKSPKDVVAFLRCLDGDLVGRIAVPRIRPVVSWARLQGAKQLEDLLGPSQLFRDRWDKDFTKRPVLHDESSTEDSESARVSATCHLK
ncbi:unnamed protein product, partial [Polarella glacialis]